MAGSLNKARVIGRLGRDPESRAFSNGGSVVSFPLATSDTWKDRQTGERREKTQWHQVEIYNVNVGRVAMDCLKKGDQVYIEGKIETRKWQDKTGNNRYATSIAVRPFSGEMTMFGGGSRRGACAAGKMPPPRSTSASFDDIYDHAAGYGRGRGYGDYRPKGPVPDDEIPF